MIFPRYHQWDAVLQARGRRARARRRASNYLVQHSAGSGKSNTIAWLAHRLSSLHDAADTQGVRQGRRRHRPRRARPAAPGHDLPVRARARRRRADRQGLAAARRRARGRAGADHHHDAQKFPFVLDKIDALPGAPLRGDRRRGALVADRRGRRGPAARARRVGRGAAAAAESADAADERSGDGAGPARAVAGGARRASRTCRSSPSPRRRRRKTLELFGTPTERRGAALRPFHLYSMRQAIEEGFILDVLANYTTYKTYCRLEKAIDDDPEYDDAQGAARDRAVRDAAPAQPRAEGRDHRRALPRAHARTKIGGRGQGDGRDELAPARGALQAGDRRATSPSTATTTSHALVAFSGTVDDDGRRVHRAEHERLPRVADRRAVRRATTTRCSSWPRSSRPASTSRCCTRCTSTRRWPGSTRCRRSRG